MTTKQQKQLIKLTYKLEVIQDRIDELLVDLAESFDDGGEEVFEWVDTITAMFPPTLDGMYEVTGYLIKQNPALSTYNSKCIDTIKSKLIRDEEQ
jgi:hypothetical protein